MKKMLALTGLMAGLVLMVTSSVLAGTETDAAKSFEEGNALLAKGDFDGALKAYEIAAKADSKNEEYTRQYAIIRRVVDIRTNLDTEKDVKAWGSMANSLCSFYQHNSLYTEALTLARQIHTKLNNSDSAETLGGLLLTMKRNSEASEFFSSLNEETHSPSTQVLMGIALARQGNIDQAKECLKKCELSDKSDRGLYYNHACLDALVGDTDTAVKNLVRSFELTPPSSLEQVKTDAQKDPDLASVVKTQEFASALKTQSTVKDAGCGGCKDKKGCGKTDAKKGCSKGAKDAKGAKEAKDGDKKAKSDCPHHQ